MHSPEYVHEVAAKARISFEKREVPKDLLAQLYSAYNPDVEIDGFLRQAAILFPRFNCGLATVYLQKILGGDIINGSFASKNHTFLALGDLAVDITGDQFDGPEVYVGPIVKPWSIETAYKGF